MKIVEIDISKRILASQRGGGERDRNRDSEKESGILMFRKKASRVWPFTRAKAQKLKAIRKNSGGSLHTKNCS